MSPLPIPPGTTLIIRGGRPMLPAGNWHEPDAADIAVAGDTIAGVAPAFAPIADAAIEKPTGAASGPAGLHQRALSFP